MTRTRANALQQIAHLRHPPQPRRKMLMISWRDPEGEDAEARQKMGRRRILLLLNKDRQDAKAARRGITALWGVRMSHGPVGRSVRKTRARSLPHVPVRSRFCARVPRPWVSLGTAADGGKRRESQQLLEVQGALEH